MKAIASAYALSEHCEFHPTWKHSANPEKVTEKTKTTKINMLQKEFVVYNA